MDTKSFRHASLCPCYALAMPLAALGASSAVWLLCAVTLRRGADRFRAATPARFARYCATARLSHGAGPARSRSRPLLSSTTKTGSTCRKRILLRRSLHAAWPSASRAGRTSKRDCGRRQSAMDRAGAFTMALSMSPRRTARGVFCGSCWSPAPMAGENRKTRWLKREPGLHDIPRQHVTLVG